MVACLANTDAVFRLPRWFDFETMKQEMQKMQTHFLVLGLIPALLHCGLRGNNVYISTSDNFKLFCFSSFCSGGNKR